MLEIGSEFDFDSNNKFIDINEPTLFLEDAEFYRSGRDALKAIAKNFEGRYKRILLPALCCESMVAPFLTNGYEILYYKLNPDLTASVDDVLSKLQSNSLFLYMNYFGIQSFSEENLQLLRQSFNSVIMIEDKTHDFLFIRKSYFVPDFTVCSIRKWLALPDGGLLYSKSDKLNASVENDLYFTYVRKKALKNKSEYLESGRPHLKELFRKQLADANTYLDNDKAVVNMSKESLEIIRYINFKKILEIRRENVKVLHQALINIKTVKSIIESSIDESMLYYPAIFNDRDRTQKVLAEKGIFCPVIWPLPYGAKGICKVADYVSTNMLALPCDHRYGSSDMEYIINMLIKV